MDFSFALRVLRKAAFKGTSAFIILGLLACAPHLASAQSLPPTKPCGTPGGPSCPPPPPILTPWNYGFQGFNNSSLSGFWSLGEFNAAYIADINRSTGCPGATVSTVDPYGPPSYVYLGVPLDYYLLPTYTEVYNLHPGACDGTIGPNTTHNSSGKTRNMYCPNPLQFVYHAGPPVVGPYCGPPGFPGPLTNKVVGKNCPCKASSQPNSGGAQAGSGVTVAGDPVDVSHGNNYVEEVDYAGSGTNSLRFVRSYNSVTAYLEPSFPGLPQPLGIVWTATYFQTLVPVSITDGSTTYSAVHAVRPDGKVISFVQYLSAFVPDADVADTLTTITGGYQYHTADDTVETYDTTGKLLTISPHGGTPVTVNYNPGYLHPASVSDAFGHTLTFSYAVSSSSQYRLASITDPAGNTVTYAYGTGDLLVSATYQDGTSHQNSYGASGIARSLTQLTDEAGVAYTTWTYAPGGTQTVGSSHAGGVDSYTFAYLGGGASRTITDPLGTVRTYGQSMIQGAYRETSGSSLCPRCGGDASRAYDANGNISSRTDFSGHHTTYVYDQDRNLETSRTEAASTPRARTITTTWDPYWRRPALITEFNRSTGFTYDSNGNLLTKTATDTSVTPNVARVWTYTYDSNNRVLTADGPRTDVSDVTTYTYYTCSTGYQCGQLQTMTDSVGNVTTYNSYNAHGQPLTITDPNGIVTTLAYDLRQRLTSRTTAGETTSFSYYPTALLHTVTLPDGSFISYTYDGAHRLTQVTDGAGNRVVYTLDAMGNRTAENVYDPTSALHRTHSRVINALNQLYQDVNAAGSSVTTTFAYDSNGNRTSIAAPLSRTNSNQFDELNRLKQITDPASGVTQLGYDANDNLTSVSDPRSLATSYTYNGFGDLRTQMSPDTGTITNTYDSGGNLATSADARGAIATYAHDVLNRVTSVAYSLGGTTDQTLVFSYDTGTNGKGHLTGASDANHSMSWGYDAVGRATSKSQTVGSTALSMTYGYTSADLTSVLTPSGQLVTYGYNANHQVTSVAVNGVTVLTSATYEPIGPVNGWTWGNSTTTSRTYDTDGKISQIADAGTKTLSYDNAFRITGLTDSSTGAANWTYGYDSLDRTTSGSASSGTTRGWTYDGNGNRLTESGTSASTYSISSTSNRISGITGALARTYAYDAAGDTLSYSSVSATYNDAGRLSTLTQAGVTETLIYNALGQRIKTTGGAAGTALYVYDGAGHLVGEYDGTGALVEETVWLGDIPVATLRPHSGGGVDVFYVHTDQLNTPRTVTRPSDNMLMWSWFSDPFGTDAANENPAGAGTFKYNLRFAGQIFDGQAGLHDNGHRAYDPAVGGYTQSDPIGLAGGTYSTYAYANGNPASVTDPLGLAPPARPGTPPTVPTVWPPNVAIPETPENNAWVQSFWNWWTNSDAPPFPAAPPGDTSAVTDPMQTARGNVADTQIVKDYGEAASAARLCGTEPPDRCEWLKQNASKYRRDQVIATQKAWGCRGSRASK